MVFSNKHAREFNNQPTPTTSPLIEGIIERLALAITHSEQGVYAKNEEFVRGILLTSLQKIEKETIENAKWYEKVYSDDYRKQIEKETIERVLRVWPEYNGYDGEWGQGWDASREQATENIKKEFKRE